MKKLFTLLVVCVMALCLTNKAIAADKDDVKKAVIDLWRAWSAGDAAAIAQHYTPGMQYFAANGSLFERSNLFSDPAGLKALFDSGFKINNLPQHIEVDVHGNIAIISCYLVGTSTAPDGTVTQAMDRRTSVRIKMGNQWKVIQLHSSPVIVPAQ